MQKKANEDLVAEIQELRAQLDEAQETLNAIRRGEVDGLVVSTPKGDQVYTITGAERPYRALIEDMREGAVMLSDDNTILYCNSGFAKMMRRSAEKIVGAKIESMICPTYFPALKELLTLSRAHKGAKTKEVTLQAKEDVLVPTLMSVDSLQSDTLKNTFLVVTDLSEHMEEEVKRYTQELEIAQIALSESEQRWATTLASIGDAVIATDMSGKIRFMNGVAEELTRWTLKEALGRQVQDIFKIVNEFTHKIVDDPVTKVLDKGMIVGLANHTILLRKDGSEVPIDDSGAPIKDKDGKTTGVVLIFRDIAKRRKSEEALRVSEERFRLVLRNSPVNVSGQDLDLCYTWIFNPQLGYSSQDVVGKTDFELLPPETAKTVIALKRKALATGSQVREELSIAHEGKTLYYDFTIEPSRDSNDRIIGVNNIVVEITERKQMEAKLEEYRKHLEDLVEERTKQLKDSERLATIGATAGMVGHDIRNPLQAIVGDLYLAREEIADMPNGERKQAMQDSIAEIEKNIDYINKIVADLQDFARPLKPNVEETDLKCIIDELLAKNGLPENVEVCIKVETGKIVADSTFINRIMYNLVTNAVQAMPKGGKLTIHSYREANDTVISVKDTGVGIPHSVKGKLFTPMFTTKARGQGFGLAVIKRMTESLGGTVSFESEEGKGTTFMVRLPPPQELNGKWTYKKDR